MFKRTDQSGSDFSRMISIIIPAKNEETDLPVLLKSITQQTLQPKEVILADADSQDRTVAIAQSLGAQIVRGGLPSVGRNAGAAAATADLLLFLDADVELRDPEFLEKSLGEMLERKLDIATCDVFPLSDKYRDHVLHQAYNTYVRAWGSVFPHAPGFCMFVRKDLHDRIGGFDEEISFCEDHDYARRANKHGQFGFLHSTKIPVSIRRLDRDGRLSVAIKYILAELHLAALGPIKHNLFNYQFGHKKQHSQEEYAKSDKM
ncbi:glycosyltransferase [Patescibacteria group bacterium]|nr:glycosyltransferase [Patescibacteria group bacterium]MBU1705622.1 glycosyltransferase [Patescibacteria group bacterium]